MSTAAPKFEYDARVPLIETAPTVIMPGTFAGTMLDASSSELPAAAMRIGFRADGAGDVRAVPRRLAALLAVITGVFGVGVAAGDAVEVGVGRDHVGADDAVLRVARPAILQIGVRLHSAAVHDRGEDAVVA